TIPGLSAHPASSTAIPPLSKHQSSISSHTKKRTRSPGRASQKTMTFILMLLIFLSLSNLTVHRRLFLPNPLLCGVRMLGFGCRALLRNQCCLRCLLLQLFLFRLYNDG